MEKTETKKSSTVNIALTEVCNKSERKIIYTRKDSVVLIESQNPCTSNFMCHFRTLLKDMFLPKGYPESVSDDYLEYQIWDTCQAFCSSISGTLAMRAVLQGVGVGSKTATPVSAAVTWLLKDGTGMIGSILFAWLKGSKLDSDCKKWRLFADITNDIAMFLELYVPYVLEHSVYMLCIATVFKALVGTAGSSTRAALITHQAIKGNIADVSAKDGSQEIFISLCAFVFGIFLLKYVTETRQIWTVMCTSTLLHLIFNYKAVRCLKINVFNSERFCICLRTYLPTSVVPTVAQVNNRESVFLMQGVSDKEICGFYIKFGACLHNVFEATKMSGSVFSSIMTMFHYKKYIIIPQLKKKTLYVGLQQNVTESDVLKAYFHAIVLGISLNYLQEWKNLTVISRCRKNSPIYRLTNILKEFLAQENKGTGSEEQNFEVIVQAFGVCEDFIEKEFTAFSSLCDQEGWTTYKHLINIGDWRAQWRSPEKKELKFSPTQIFEKLRSPRPPSQPHLPAPQPPPPAQNRKMQALVIS